MKRKTITIMASTFLAATLAPPLSAGDQHAEGEEAVDRTAGQVVDDMTIAARTKAALAEDETTHAIDIDIEVDRDEVQLNGFVDSEAARERAEAIARGIRGVASVVNNLEVRDRERTAGEYIDDKVLITKVKAALADHPDVNSLVIDVESNRGVVSLGGHVDTQAEKDAAYEAASQVPGVVEVVNNLDVRA